MIYTFFRSGSFEMGLDWQSLDVRPIAVLFNQSFSLEDQRMGLIMKNTLWQWFIFLMGIQDNYH